MDENQTLRLKVKDATMGFLKGLSKEDRLELLSVFCPKCGDESHMCDCEELHALDKPKLTRKKAQMIVKDHRAANCVCNWGEVTGLCHDAYRYLKLTLERY